MNKDNPKGRVRYCWFCGASMGFVADKYYDRGDTCGRHECEREARDQHRAETDELHEQIDRDRHSW